MKHRVTLEYDPIARSFSAVCSELPGCVSIGDSVKVASENIRNTISPEIEIFISWNLDFDVVETEDGYQTHCPGFEILATSKTKKDLGSRVLQSVSNSIDLAQRPDLIEVHLKWPTNRKQQEREHHDFARFLKAHPFPSGTIILYDDAPDVIAEICGRKIGIEHTNFYLEPASPNSEQVQKRRREAVVKEAQQRYESATNRNTELSFGFDTRHPIGAQKQQRALSSQMALLAQQVHNHRNGQLLRTSFSHIPELDFAYLNAQSLVYTQHVDPEFPNGEPEASSDFTTWARYQNRRDAQALQEGIYKPLSWQAEWRVIQTYSTGMLPTDRLAEILREKERKAELYTPCDGYWLLAVVDFFDRAQDQEIRCDDILLTSNTFEHVIVYKTVFDHILTLTPQKAPAA